KSCKHKNKVTFRAWKTSSNRAGNADLTRGGQNCNSSEICPATNAIFRQFSVFSMEVSMRRQVKFAGLCIGLLLFGVVCGFQLRGQGQPSGASQATAPAPADTAAMRANYERWRTE